MGTPPTLVSYADSGNFATSTPTATVYTIASVTVQTGDILTLFGALEVGGNSWSAPAGGGLTYTQQQKPNADDDAGHADTHLWTTTATSSTTFDITATKTGASTCAGMAVYVWRNAALGTPVTAGNEDAGTAPSLAITTAADNSAIPFMAVDFNAADGTTRTWRTINSITPTAGNGGEKLYARNASSYTVYCGYWSDAGTAGSKTTGLSAPTGQLPDAVAIEIQGVAAAGVPWAPRQQARTADAGETYWTQRRQLDLGPAAAANPLDVPLLASARMAQRAATHARPGWSRPAPSQANQGAAAGTAYDPTLAPPPRTLAAYTTRRVYPAQRSYPAAPDAVTDVGTGRLNAWWSDDPEPVYIAATMPRRADPSLLAPPPAGFDPTLAGAATARMAPATHADRRQVPQQPRRLAQVDATTTVGTGAVNAWWSDDPAVAYLAATMRRGLDPSLINPPVTTPADPLSFQSQTSRRMPVTHADRREVPAQRQGFLPAPETVTQVGTGRLNAWWSIDDWAHFGPAQQRRFASFDDVQVVGTGSLVAWWGVDDTAAYLGQRRPAGVPAAVASSPLDPTTAAWLPLWLAYNRAATHADRRLVPQQPPRRTLYFDAGPGQPPLTLAWGAGGMYWHLYNRPSRPRPFWPQRLPFPVEAECDCTTHRPNAGTTARPSSGTTGRPNAGVTARPCTCS